MLAGAGAKTGQKISEPGQRFSLTSAAVGLAKDFCAIPVRLVIIWVNPMLDDAELLRRYAEERSEEAFAEFVHRSINLVYSAALRRTGGNAHAAADVAQDVFLAAARQARGLSRHARLTGWLYSATRNVAVNLMRDEQRRQRRELEAAATNEIPDASATAGDWSRLRPVLDEAMDDLSATDREVVLLRFFEGRALAEIGRRMDVSENTARMRIERALDKLQVSLSRRGVTSTSGALAVVLANQAVASAPAGLAASVVSWALSGTAATIGAGTFATVMYFMSSSKVTVSLATAGMLAMGAAVYQSSQARVAAADLAKARDRHAALVARFAALETSVNAAEQAERAAALERQRRENAASSSAALHTPALDDINAKYVVESNRLRRTDPEAEKLRQQMSRSEGMVRNRAFLQTLGLGPEQMAQALDLLANKSGQTFRDVFGDAADERLAQLRAQARKEAREIDELKWLSRNSCDLDAPFTPQQFAQLKRIFANAATEPSFQKIGDESYDAAYRRTRDWNQILAQAESVLSPPQLQRLRGLAAYGRIDVQKAAQVTAEENQQASDTQRLKRAVRATPNAADIGPKK